MIIKKFPCEECISLAICVNAMKINCSILMEFINGYANAKYPTWPELSDRLREVLRGNWCTVAINNNVYMIQKDRTADDWFGGGIYD